jgi:hypothetical protein
MNHTKCTKEEEEEEISGVTSPLFENDNTQWDNAYGRGKFYKRAGDERVGGVVIA